MAKPIIRKIVFRHSGEWYYTPKTAFIPLEDFNEQEHGSLDKIVIKGDWDDDGCANKVHLYEVRGITLPDWLTPQEYCRDIYVWEKISILGDSAFKWPEQWVRKIMHMTNPCLRDVCITLLETKQFRSSFRKSCRDQLVAWLNNPNPKYDTPLSPRQLNALTPQGEHR